ncbi:MAG: hypothetical protein ACI9JN_000406 [Bacteroidia bacterium]|jgi:hypothetical protein
MLWGCGNGDIGNYAPTIGLESLDLLKTESGKDSLMFIRFWYEDKDGDLGLADSDTNDQFRGFNNLLINFKEKINGVYSPLLIKNTTIPANFNQRIPDLTPTGKNKEISGSISVSFGIDPNEIHADTIEFDLQIVDRSFNKSNIISKSDVALEQQ